MIELHYWPTPNGKKVTILLEECGLPYKISPVNIQQGAQFTRQFLKMNPNHRMPVMVDHAPTGGGAPITVFESGSIMMYLAEKAGQVLAAGRARQSTRSTSGSSGRWPTRARSSANAAISAGSATARATSPTPSAASPTRPTGSTA